MKKLAAITTVFFPNSHADVILSRWNKALPGDAAWGWKPDGRSKIVSVSIEQFPKDSPDGKNDCSAKYIEEHQVTLFATPEDALTLGGDSLAVDGVLLIGEHGDYPYNERGQKLYPRKELFDRIVSVFKKSGRVVPIFCDKHLSWNPDWAVEMVETAQAMRIPFMAGSTTPYCGTVPPLEINPTDTVEEAFGLYYGGEEVYAFHSLEFVQEFLQCRAGGETGIRSITAYRGVAVEQALGEHGIAMIEAGLAVASNRENVTSYPWRTGDSKNFVLYVFEHKDGLISRHLMMNGCIKDWIAVFKVKGESQYRTARAKMGDADTFYAHFATLDHLIEQMMLTGVAPVPINRILFTTRMIAKAVEALMQPGQKLTVDIPYALR